MQQVVQLGGAILILIAFVAAQRGQMSPQSLPYLLLNFVGSLVLFAIAIVGRDLGFMLLEGVWAAVSGYGLVTRNREGRQAPTPGASG